MGYTFKFLEITEICPAEAFKMTCRHARQENAEKQFNSTSKSKKRFLWDENLQTFNREVGKS